MKVLFAEGERETSPEKAAKAYLFWQSTQKEAFFSLDLKRARHAQEMKRAYGSAIFAWLKIPEEGRAAYKIPDARSSGGGVERLMGLIAGGYTMAKARDARLVIPGRGRRTCSVLSFQKGDSIGQTVVICGGEILPCPAGHYRHCSGQGQTAERWKVPLPDPRDYGFL